MATPSDQIELMQRRRAQHGGPPAVILRPTNERPGWQPSTRGNPAGSKENKQGGHLRSPRDKADEAKTGGTSGRKGTQPSRTAAHEVRVPHPGPLLHSMHLPRNPPKPARPSKASSQPSPATIYKLAKLACTLSWKTAGKMQLVYPCLEAKAQREREAQVWYVYDIYI